MRRNAGFTLLEAMVALVLIGGAGMALFSWVNANIVTLRRVEDANTRNEAVSNIIEYMQSVNPMLIPEGKANFGNYQIHWKSEPVTAAVDGISNPQSVGLYQLRMYRTQIQAEKADDLRWFNFQLTLVGYKKVRNKQAPF